MATGGRRHARDTLRDVARTLGDTAAAFTPHREVPAAPLPGRRTRPQVDDASRDGDSSVILDVGTSRRASFTHVLWIAELDASAMDAVERAVRDVDGVSDAAWEGCDHLHVAAPEMSHRALLLASRSAVASLSDGL